MGTATEDPYDLLYELYDEFDTRTLDQYRTFVDLFPPIDSRVALDHWQEVNEALAEATGEIEEHFERGELLAAIAARASREEAFTALDLYKEYGRAVNVLVLDVDETLRSAGSTDNEIPRETLSILTDFHDQGVPIVIPTGQTLENVKGFLIQGLGSELFHSGSLSVVYEAGTGAFTPGYGPATKRLLYEDLDEGIRAVFDRLRSRVLSAAPEAIRQGCHLQGNEFNVTLKPNFEIGSDEAIEIIDRALIHQIDLLGEAVSEVEGISTDAEDAIAWARTFYAAADPEIRSVLEADGELPERALEDAPEELEDFFERIDVAYYEGDAAEIGSLELNKVVGIEAAFEVLGLDDPFALVLGDSKSDLRVMEWVAEEGMGIAGAPEHASIDVLDHVIRTDELVFDRGDAASVLKITGALNRLARLD
ncbi:HAD family hydrolase [Halobacteriales archaeon QS_3_64_16]|nr:MAG: HAD family hydrolase [Halobacteriales archaeon QS_3_64_16]